MKDDKKIILKNRKFVIKKDNVLKTLKLFKKNFSINKKQAPFEIYYYLVSENILFLDPTKGLLKPQSKLTWHAIKEIS